MSSSVTSTGAALVGAQPALSAQPQRSAIVTGSSGGIGAAIAARLLADGWQVQGLDITPASIHHAAFTAHQVDLSDAALTDAVLHMLLAPGVSGVPGAVVHAAGLLRVGRAGSLQHADAQLMWQLHVAAAQRVANTVLPAMQKARAGRMVLIGSRVSRGMPGRSQYAATKAALVSLARSWAAESIAAGVTVNVISPAATATRMLQDPARAGTDPRVPPLGRFIVPEEIAALTAYLLSPEAAAITGQDIAVCGGASLPH